MNVKTIAFLCCPKCGEIVYLPAKACPECKEPL